MFLFRSFGSRHNLTFCFPSAVSEMLHTIELNTISGLWWQMMSWRSFFQAQPCRVEGCEVIQFMGVDHWYSVACELNVILITWESANFVETFFVVLQYNRFCQYSLFSSTRCFALLLCSCELLNVNSYYTQFLCLLATDHWWCPGASTILKLVLTDYHLWVSFSLVILRLSMQFPP